MKFLRSHPMVNAMLSTATAYAAYSLAPNGAPNEMTPVVTMLSGLSLNYASQFSYDTISPWINKTWIKNPDEAVNHHISKSLVAAWKNSIEETFKEYIKVNHTTTSTEKSSLESLKSLLLAISKQEFMTKLKEDVDNKEIFSYAENEIGSIMEFLRNRFNFDEKFDQREFIGEQFIDYFISEMPGRFSFYFRIELKKGEEAKHALDLLYFGAIREAINIQTKSLTEQKAILETLKTSAENLPMELNEQKHRIVAASNQIRDEILQAMARLESKVDSLIHQTEDPLINNFLGRTYNIKTLFKSNYVGFYGRETEWQMLDEFCADPKSFQWWIITAPGGSGKSKLALKYLQALSQELWTSGFIGTDEFISYNWKQFKPKTDWFIVLDYAALRFAEVLLIMEKLEQLMLSSTKKIRLLLLERTAGAFGSGTTQIQQNWRTQLDEALKSQQICLPWNPIFKLKPLNQKDLWNIIVDVFNRENTAIPPRPEAMNFLHYADPLGRPLFAIQAGYFMSKQGYGELVNQEGLLRNQLIREESKIWQRLCNDPILLEKHKALAFAATITGGITEPMLDQLRLHPANKYFPTDEEIDDKLFQLISQKSFPEDLILYSAIEPDLVGEAMVAHMIIHVDKNQRYHNLKLKTIIDYCWNTSAAKTRQFVDRYLQDRYFITEHVKMLTSPIELYTRETMVEFGQMLVQIGSYTSKYHGHAETKYWADQIRTTFHETNDEMYADFRTNAEEMEIRSLLEVHRIDDAMKLWSAFTDSLSGQTRSVIIERQVFTLGFFHRSYLHIAQAQQAEKILQRVRHLAPMGTNEKVDKVLSGLLLNVFYRGRESGNEQEWKEKLNQLRELAHHSSVPEVKARLCDALTDMAWYAGDEGKLDEAIGYIPEIHQCYLSQPSEDLYKKTSLGVQRILGRIANHDNERFFSYANHCTEFFKQKYSEQEYHDFEIRVHRIAIETLLLGDKLAQAEQFLEKLNILWQDHGTPENKKDLIESIGWVLSKYAYGGQPQHAESIYENLRAEIENTDTVDLHYHLAIAASQISLGYFDALNLKKCYEFSIKTRDLVYDYLDINSIAIYPRMINSIMHRLIKSKKLTLAGMLFEELESQLCFHHTDIYHTYWTQCYAMWSSTEDFNNQEIYFKKLLSLGDRYVWEEKENLIFMMFATMIFKYRLAENHEKITEYFKLMRTHTEPKPETKAYEDFISCIDDYCIHLLVSDLHSNLNFFREEVVQRYEKIPHPYAGLKLALNLNSMFGDLELTTAPDEEDIYWAKLLHRIYTEHSAHESWQGHKEKIRELSMKMRSSYQIKD
ncbi:MAG: hypothetical protein V4687_03060 [Bacteroidota bacterium]